MNNDELDKLLKSARAPEPSGAYWRDFPKKVTAKLHWQSATRPQSAPSKDLRIFLAWGFAVAVCIALVCISRLVSHTTPASETDAQLAEARKCYREFESLFPNQLRAIVFDKQGPRMVLADKAAVPSSTPFYLKVCGREGCEHFVTFSGQEIQFQGQKCQVLADPQGRIILVGNDRVWSQDDPSTDVRIQAHPLEATL